MNNFLYQNTLINKKQLKQILAWSFTMYDSMQACGLADDLKSLGFKYASQAGISISLEDLRVPNIKKFMLEKAYQDIRNSEKVYLKGKITNVEKFQKIIDTWSITSEALKEEIISFFKKYDPLNSVYIMAFSGARGNLSQVRQLVGMRGLMSDPSGEIMNLPIKKNFREGLTITDYLMSGYGARKGIIDTALKTANSGYLTRRLIDVAQDILIREHDCLTFNSYLIKSLNRKKILGRLLSKSVFNMETQELIAEKDTQITSSLIQILIKKNIKQIFVRSPLTCILYRSICQKCYGWDLATENLVDIGESVGIISGQSIGEPGTQLTMRTFHTGGIFTSEISKKIKSPIDGIVKFSKLLKRITVRTNQGEDVLLTKNSGSVIIVSGSEKKDFSKIAILRNTILFIKNNQFVKKNAIIGELIDGRKKTRSEIRPVLADNSGEIFIPSLKNKLNSANRNKLLWLLSGQVFKSPKSSFTNFYGDFKITKNSYIYRTKLISYSSGYTNLLNISKYFGQSSIQVIANNKLQFNNLRIQKLLFFVKKKNYVILFKNYFFFISLKLLNNNKIFQLNHGNKCLVTVIENNYKTLTGGTPYYNQKIKSKPLSTNNKIYYYKSYSSLCNFKSITSLHFKNFKNKFFLNSYPYLKARKNQYHILAIIIIVYNILPNTTNRKALPFRTIIWRVEETLKLHCDKSLLLVVDNIYICKNFEIVPGTFSKTAGVVSIFIKNNIVKEVTIKSGLVYVGKRFKKFDQKVYFPGEALLNKIPIKEPSLCEYLKGKNHEQFIIRPLTLFEVPRPKSIKKFLGPGLQSLKNLDINNNIYYLYKSYQKVKTTKNIDLVINSLRLFDKHSLRNQLQVQILNKLSSNSIELRILKKIYLKHCLFAQLRYTDIFSCFIVKSKQFVDRYTVLGYFENISSESLEIVKLKSKTNDLKQICLISNKDCLIIKDSKNNNKIIDNLIINNFDVNNTGKILIKNNDLVTIQKGRPYFFPNCQENNTNELNNQNINYKSIYLPTLIPNFTLSLDRSININYYDITKGKINRKKNITDSLYSFTKIFIQKNGKLFSSVTLGIIKSFILKKNNLIQNPFSEFIPSFYKNSKISEYISNEEKRKIRKFKKYLNGKVSLFTKTSSFNLKKLSTQKESSLTLVKFITPKICKNIGIHCITDDFFDQQMNTVFCTDGEFVKKGQTIGLLNFDKEITGDIVQGLPRIEQLLEARKNKQLNKCFSTNEKKSLLIQKSSIDSYFDFRKLGTSIKENDKINPHKLLKTYFTYYGLAKQFFNQDSNYIDNYQLVNNYEASYRSFKKVQSLILNSVQSVYNSQGVSIADKHLEIIVKQMTSKVLITHQGATSLLPREVIDLYHIEYINEVISKHKKQQALYVPLLLGITKAALNNPSFISAASFQETTRVLTKAAMDGRLDWLRGLKENIITGHLIPAGTGRQNYRNCFIKK